MFDISSRFKEIRLNNELSANKLSKMLDVDPSTLSKIENGTSKPSMDLLLKFCNALNVTLNDFFNDNSNAVILDEDTKELLKTIQKLSFEEKNALNSFLKILKK